MKKPKQASWRTLMRKASKTPSKDAAERLRQQAAALRRAERATKRAGGGGGGGTTHKAFPGLIERAMDRERERAADKRVKELAHKRLESFEREASQLEYRSKAFVSATDPKPLLTNSQDSFDEAIEELENSKLLQAELELRRRDTQLIAEFMSAIETIKPTQKHGQHLTVPWSQVEAIVSALTRLRWLETK